MADAYKPYTGTFDTEYASAFKRADRDRRAQDAALGGLRQTDEQNLAQSRNYSLGQLNKKLTSAQRGNYTDYMQRNRTNPLKAQMSGITGGGQARMNALTGQGYVGTRAATQSSHDTAAADVRQQWQQGMGDIASNYGQLGYQNLQNLYNNANNYGWQAYETALGRDTDMWTRDNTSWWQKQQQATADRDYKFARKQWAANKDLQELQYQLARKQAGLE